MPTIKQLVVVTLSTATFAIQTYAAELFVHNGLDHEVTVSLVCDWPTIIPYVVGPGDTTIPDVCDTASSIGIDDNILWGSCGTADDSAHIPYTRYVVYSINDADPFADQYCMVHYDFKNSGSSLQWGNWQYMKNKK